MRARTLIVLLVSALALTGLPGGGSAVAVPNPVATDDATYTAFGRVFPDPQGCLQPAAGALPKGVSPWAKGRVCATQFLQYQEVIDGTRFLDRKFPRFLQIIRLDQAFDNPNFRSAGIPRTVVTDDGSVKLLGRDRRPLYLFRVTDEKSAIPEKDRLHFAYSLSIHGPERAGLEGGIRALEDLVTWAACEEDQAASPVCANEGVSPQSPQHIVETAENPEDEDIPTAGEVLRRSVIYFLAPNPDGWARGQVSPVEVRDGGPNANYSPGAYFQRYNGNGVDLNRDWPTIGYTFKPYSPGSEPETSTYTDVLSRIRKRTGSFAGGIDLHGMLDANAFSYTLLGASERDFRENRITVDTSIRTWEDQTERLAWSPYVGDAQNDGHQDEEDFCIEEAVPACVADQWGTVIDTIGYQITGGVGDWLDSPLGLDAVGIDNEMYMSHVVPNVVFEPALEQSHIDGNKGLIYSQISSLLAEEPSTFRPGGDVGYVFNPERLRVPAGFRPPTRKLPAQNDVEALIPCQTVARDVQGGCDDGEFSVSGTSAAFEFDVKGPADGIWNGGMTVTYTGTNVTGISPNAPSSIMQLQVKEEGTWHPVAYHFQQGTITSSDIDPEEVGSDIYAPAGQIATVNDPKPARWRVYFEYASVLPGRVKIDFKGVTAEDDPGQVPVNASSMEFYEDLNKYAPEGQELQAVSVGTVRTNPRALSGLDTLILTNNLGSGTYLEEQFGLTGGQVSAFFSKLRKFVKSGGNLVLVDAALQAMTRMGSIRVDPADVDVGQGLAGNYNFQLAPGLVTYEQPDKYPLARDVDKPGTAEQQRGRRQAAEPVPIGYTPDTYYDPDPQMPFWGVEKDAWEAVCGLENCSTAATRQNGDLINLGEAKLGRGRVRIAGILLPDPVFEPDQANDHRFGIADYALTYTSYEVFENLLDWQRPAAG